MKYESSFSSTLALYTASETFTAFIRWVKKCWFFFFFFKWPKLCLVRLQLIRADKWRRMRCATTSARAAAEIWMCGVSARLSRSHFSRRRCLSGISCDRGIQGERGLLQKPSPLPLIICQPGLTGRGTRSHTADRRATCAIGFGPAEPEHLTRERKWESCCAVILRRSSRTWLFGKELLDAFNMIW